MNEPLSSILDRLLPPEAGEELRRNIDAAIQGYLERMNLATREQLEIQEKVLRRTGKRLRHCRRLHCDSLTAGYPAAEMMRAKPKGERVPGPVRAPGTSRQ
ncbi:MAG: accessory factor UbiK family protein [Gammaproteobacteria bacterium]|nr:accessory factor UbiK family protein [Gammaproteobacteria bacterium]